MGGEMTEISKWAEWAERSISTIVDGRRIE
jgi:hypothetical protein